MVNHRKPTYLYVLGEPGSATVKIGMTMDLEDRVQQIQRMCAVKIELLWARPAPYTLERALHRHFAEQRSHGEWFTFAGDPLAQIKSAIDSGLTDVPDESTPEEHQDEPEMSQRQRMILDGLRQRYSGVWFSVQEAAERLQWMDTSMRDGLEDLCGLGKVTRGPARMNWRNRRYALVAGTRA